MKYDQIEDILHKAKLKVTPNRIALLDLLCKKDKAISYALIQKHFKEMNRVSLYRLLNDLEEAELIERLSDYEGKPVYIATFAHDGHEHTHEHVHFNCKKCEKVVCFDKVEMPQVSIPDGYSANKFQFVVYGFCPDCSNKKI